MRLRLFYTPIHGFIHKVLVTAYESGVWDQLEFIPVYPVKDGYSIAAINPLHKVPTLVLDNYEVIYGSQAIVEYLDSFSAPDKKLFPLSGPERWDSLRRLALADTLFEITVVMALERLQKPPRQSVFDWNWAKVVRAVNQMEKDALSGFNSFDIGQVSSLHALSYLDRQTNRGLHPPVPEDWNWRDGRYQLNEWWEESIKRQSVQSHFNKEYDGDDSPEFCQQKVAEVLKGQGKPIPSKIEPIPVDFVPPA